MATKREHPVGPFPPGVETDDEQVEYDRTRRRVLWAMPSGLYLVGSRGSSPERMNLMTLNWASQVSFEPKLVGVGVEKSAFTHELILEGASFSLNILDRDARAVVRKFVKPASVDLAASTLNGFEFTTGVTGCPLLAQAVAHVDCRLWEALDCGGHTWFVGEVADVGFRKPEDTPVLRMEDTRMSYGG